jgi:hypothetical protein
VRLSGRLLSSPEAPCAKSKSATPWIEVIGTEATRESEVLKREPFEIDRENLVVVRSDKVAGNHALENFELGTVGLGEAVAKYGNVIDPSLKVLNYPVVLPNEPPSQGCDF